MRFPISKSSFNRSTAFRQRLYANYNSKMKIVCALVLCLGIFMPVHCEKADFHVSPMNWIDDLITEIINNIKDIIVEGDPENGIPPLDPIKLENIPIDINTQLLKARGSVKNVETSGLKGLEAVHVKSKLFPPSVDIKMSMPLLSMTGNYSIEGMAALIFPVYGEGPFSVKVGEIIMGGQGALNMTGGVSVRDFDYVLELGTLDFKFEGLLGGGELGDVLNEIVNTMGLTVFNTVEGLIHDFVASTLEKIINLGLSMPREEVVRTMRENFIRELAQRRKFENF